MIGFGGLFEAARYMNGVRPIPARASRQPPLTFSRSTSLAYAGGPSSPLTPCTDVASAGSFIFGALPRPMLLLDSWPASCVCPQGPRTS